MDLGKSEFPFRRTKGFGKVKTSISPKEKGMSQHVHYAFLERNGIPDFENANARTLTDTDRSQVQHIQVLADEESEAEGEWEEEE